METKKTILVVDDDTDILSQLQFLLESQGFRVITCSDSKTAFDIFKKEKPYAVATDLMMEEMDSGFMLNYQIKKTEYGKTIPVILMTAAAQVTGYKFDAFTSEEKRWLRCDAVLNKPISADELIAKIENFYQVKV